MCQLTSTYKFKHVYTHAQHPPPSTHTHTPSPFLTHAHTRKRTSSDYILRIVIPNSRSKARQMHRSTVFKKAVEIIKIMHSINNCISHRNNTILRLLKWTDFSCKEKERGVNNKIKESVAHGQYVNDWQTSRKTKQYNTIEQNSFQKNSSQCNTRKVKTETFGLIQNNPTQCNWINHDTTQRNANRIWIYLPLSTNPSWVRYSKFYSKKTVRIKILIWSLIIEIEISWGIGYDKTRFYS